MFSYVAIACMLGVALAAPSLPYSAAPINVVDSVSVPRYGFNYAVSDPITGDNKAQTEQRDGGVVKGSYSLTEPDGTLRVVDYTADPVSGFNAVVKRIGPAAHPQYAAPIITKQIAPIAAPVWPSAAYSTNLLGYDGLGLGNLDYGGIGLGNLGYGGNGLGNLGYGLKH